MKKIFYGMLFVFFNYSITFGNSSIGLVPDFIGYLLMLLGIKELAADSEYYTKLRPVLIGLFVLSLIFYLLNLLGIIATYNEVLVILINIIAVGGSLYSSYMITCGIVDMEKI